MSGNADINPMLPGQKIISIFGFCDIRNFTDATEVLQEGVMVFVNEIGEIVHKIVDNYSGAANKNIGDAFLLVWKFDKKSFIYKQDSDDITLADTNEVH
jgi:class 3 adenylate cyclase